MAANPIDPDKRHIQAQDTSNAKKVEGASSDESKKAKSLPKDALLFLTSTQLQMLDKTIDETSFNHKPNVNALREGDPVDTEGHIVDDMEALIEAFKNKEFLSDPASFFRKLFKVAVDISEVEKADLKESLLNELKSNLANLLDGEEGLEALGTSIAYAYQQLSNSSQDMRQLREVLGLFLDQDSSLFNKIISSYETSVETGKPISNIDESHQIAVNALSEEPMGPINTNDDIVGDMNDLVDAINNGEYLSDPAAFFQKLLKAGIDISRVTKQDLQDSLIDELKSRFSTLFDSEEAKGALAKAIAQAYQELSNSSEDIGQLKSVLGLLFGSSSSLVSKTIEQYLSAINSKESIPGIDKIYEIVGNAIKESRTWQSRYDNLIKRLKSGDVDFIELMSILEEGLSQLESLDPNSAEYQKLKEQMSALTKVIQPLIDNSASRARFAEMLSLYFAEVKDPAGSERRVEEFLNKLVPFYVDDPEHAIDDPHYQNLKELLSETESKMMGPGGPFDPDGAMTQDEIDSVLKGNIPIFNELVGVGIKNHDIIQNKPILMAIYIVLMSQDGAYGYLATQMSNLNVTMKKIGEISDVMKNLTDKIAEFMEEEDPIELQKLAQDIADIQKSLNNLIETNKDSIGEELVSKLKKFAKEGVGTLDNLLEKAKVGVSSWEELADDQDACSKLQDYLTASTGGSVGEGTNALLNEISQLQGALNVQNQGQLEKLNLITKKVDALTKLFSAFVTMYKGLIQTLTQYSGS